MSTDFDGKPAYGNDDKYIKKTYKDNITTNFYNKKVTKEEISYKCLSIIMLNSVLYAYEKYNPKHF